MQHNELTVAQIAALLSAQIEGDPERKISGISSLELATERELSFLRNVQYKSKLQKSRAGVLLLEPGCEYNGSATVLRCDNPGVALAKVQQLLFMVEQVVPGVSVLAFVHEQAEVHHSASIAEFASVAAGAKIAAGVRLAAGVRVGEAATVGRDSRICENVVVAAGVQVGSRCLIHPGVVLGADGFGFASDVDGHHKIQQQGTVVIEDDVEIGANSCVDRAAFGETRIGAGSKLDNLVHIAHGVSVGRNSLMAAYAAVAGSSTLGEGVVLGGRAAVLGHLEVGAGARIAAMSMATSDLKPGSQSAGIPAIPRRQWAQSSAVFKRLPQLRQMIRSQQQSFLKPGDRVQTSLERLPQVLVQLWPQHRLTEPLTTADNDQDVELEVLAVGAVVLLALRAGNSFQHCTLHRH